MSMKQFEVAARPKAVADEGIPFEYPDWRKDESKEQTFTELRAYEPNPGQFAVLMATTGRGASDADRIAGFINFFVNILDSSGSDYLTGRLLDRQDPFEIDDVEQIMDWLTEQWSGNPTQGPSVSTPSPSTDGQRSTATILS